MGIYNELNLPIPDALIEQIADRVAEKVLARLRPHLNNPVPMPASVNQPNPDKPLPTFLRLRDVAARVGVSRVTIYRWVNEGKFPQSVRLGGHAVAWRREEVEEWESSPEHYQARHS